MRGIINFKDSLTSGTKDNKNMHHFNKVLKNNMSALLDDMQSQSNEYVIKNIEFMAKAVEARDNYTSGHVGRVTAYIMVIATKLGWNQKKLEQVYLGSLLHDIGKIGISDTILNKPGPLTDEEFELVKTHVMIGVNMLKGMPRLDEFIAYVRCHHERYDGMGYPNGLKGKEIPIEGRIACVADSFDTMTTDRPYRKALSMGAAFAELERCSGTQFDSDIVEIFLSMFQSRSIGVEFMEQKKRLDAITGHTSLINMNDTR